MRWGRPRKNAKRRDPRYFLNEEVVTEDRAEHVAGLHAKIQRLEDESERAQASLERWDATAQDDMDLDDIRTHPKYWETQQRIMNMRDKVDLLQQQLQTLESGAEGERVGELPRGG